MTGELFVQAQSMFDIPLYRQFHRIIDLAVITNENFEAEFVSHFFLLISLFILRNSGKITNFTLRHPINYKVFKNIIK